jgi:hypothetical protein
VRIAVLFVFACSAPAPMRAPPPPQGPTPIADRMDTFEMNGYVLAGAEYWAYVGAEEPKQPLRGFYPRAGEIAQGETAPNTDSASPQAIDCAQQSFAALQVFLAKNPAKPRRMADARIYMRTNDYSGAAPMVVRQPQFSLIAGRWLWEATLTQERECIVPSHEQIDPYL